MYDAELPIECGPHVFEVVYGGGMDALLDVCNVTWWMYGVEDRLPKLRTPDRVSLLGSLRCLNVPARIDEVILDARGSEWQLARIDHVLGLVAAKPGLLGMSPIVAPAAADESGSVLALACLPGGIVGIDLHPINAVFHPKTHFLYVQPVVEGYHG